MLKTLSKVHIVKSSRAKDDMVLSLKKEQPLARCKKSILRSWDLKLATLLSRLLKEPTELCPELAKEVAKERPLS